MDSDIVIFWIVCFSCLTGLAMTLARIRSAGAGWVVVYLAILLVAVSGWLRHQNALIYASGAMWVVLVLLPGLIGKLYYRRLLQQRYSAACRLAQISSWLHPADGQRQQLQIVRALELAQRGELPAALEALKRFEGVKSVIGVIAVTNLFRITNQWEELLDWHRQRGHEFESVPSLLPVLLRARGETGDLRGLVEFYDRHRHRIAKLVPAESRDLCRLMLFVFCGKRQLAERLLDGSLAILPARIRGFWLATADLAAGATESARQGFDRLLCVAEPPLRVAIERRLARISSPPASLDSAMEKVIESAALEYGHDESFGARPSLFSKHARATQLLIALNVSVFAAELYLGGAADPEALYRLGALSAPAVRAGQWWRLLTSVFLHFGAIHLFMNMLALWLLGPFTEFALGFRKFLLLYLLTGIGSMSVVMGFASGAHGEQLTVGASGCIMGLVGATGGLMLRGWWREKALSAKRRLVAICTIVAMQSVFDAAVPQVSMTAHLSGALIGFAIALLFRDRLTNSSRMP